MGLDDSQSSTTINSNAEIDLKDGRGWTALLNAAFNGHKEIVNILLKNDADANLSGYYYSPLIAASEKGYKDIVTLLLQKNANINVKAGPELLVL